MYKADAASSSYSPLDQINRNNVTRLKTAWIYDPEDAQKGSRFNGSQCNPINDRRSDVCRITPPDHICT